MGTKTVRLREEDIEQLARMSGMHEAVPLGVKVHAVVRALADREAQLDALRLVVREELQRLAGRA